MKVLDGDGITLSFIHLIGKDGMIFQGLFFSLFFCFSVAAESVMIALE